MIDEVLALPLPGPGSYTGEDTVEFFCHGGRLAAARAVEACLAAGAEPAPAGEFTRRAFLNGRLSLAQAEAVADLIQAESVLAAQAAVRQLRGGLDGELHSIETPLLQLLTELEGSLEFGEDEGVEPDAGAVVATLRRAVEGIDALLDLAPAGRLLREGVHVVLAGPTNAGKSSLFNRLLGEDRALVDADPGTTRDIVVARRQRPTGMYILHDTAGLRRDPGRVEGLGIDRAWRAVREADIILAVQPADAAAGADDIAAGIRVADEDGAAPVIRVVTKADLVDGPAAPADAVVTSSVTGRGCDALWAAIESAAETFGLREAASLGVVLNERHRHKLRQCRAELQGLADAVGARETEARAAEAPGAEVVGTILSSILGGLGEISGRVFTEHLLDSVFRRFCVGK